MDPQNLHLVALKGISVWQKSQVLVLGSSFGVSFSSSFFPSFTSSLFSVFDLSSVSSWVSTRLKIKKRNQMKTCSPSFVCTLVSDIVMCCIKEQIEDGE